MRIDPATHLVVGGCYIPSPNCDDRPCGTTIDLIVIHNISLPPGNFCGPYVEQLFTNKLEPNHHPYFEDICTRRVSAHLFIRRDGALVQFVPLNKRAWHAGESCYENRTRCNDFSVGIELEGTDDQPYEDCQYKVLAALINALLICYPTLSSERIVGHCDIAPQRKTDPGPAFDWSKLRNSIHRYVAQPTS